MNSVWSRVKCVWNLFSVPSLLCPVAAASKAVYAQPSTSLEWVSGVSVADIEYAVCIFGESGNGIHNSRTRCR